MSSPSLASRSAATVNNSRGSPGKAAASPQSGLSPQRQDGQRLTNRASFQTLSSSRSEGTDAAQWGENFWITIADPQTGAQFYACPATGDASWDPPAGHFIMPPSEAGEWWELLDEARDIPYYYHTKTKETQWTRPEGFVIPLNIIQTTTALGRKFSQNARKSMVEGASDSAASTSRPGYRRARSSQNGQGQGRVSFSDGRRPSTGSIGSNNGPGAVPQTSRPYNNGRNGLYTIPSEPSNSQQSLAQVGQDEPSTPPSQTTAIPIITPSPSPNQNQSLNQSTNQKPPQQSYSRLESVPEMRTQSLQGAAEFIAGASERQGRNGSWQSHTQQRKRSDSPSSSINQESPSGSKGKKSGGMFSKMLGSSTSEKPPTQQPSSSQGRQPGGANGHGNAREDLSSSRNGRPVPAGVQAAADALNRNANKTAPPANNKTNGIGAPVLDQATTQQMNPAMRNGHKPVLVDIRRLSTGDHRILPQELAQDIQQFMTSDFAQSYFSTHRRGLIFRRRVPLEEMMTWQKSPLQSPLLNIKRPLHKDAVKAFRVIQSVMGDREIERPSRHLNSTGSNPNLSSSTTSLTGREDDPTRTGGAVSGSLALLEAERWMLSMGCMHGELRDEIYCQTMKQLTNNPDPESVFRGWQMFCVILVTFPPSKNLEAYAGSFIQERITTQRDHPDRIDVMAKYCLGRLSAIAKKGPKGKAPTYAEIETASDAAFNPSTFGASLEFIFKLQRQSYPDAKVPIILPFLADGIIALGGLQTEGIWRISGDSDTVSELKVRIDKGYYNLEGIEDCHVPAALLKLWLRELEEPLIPESMYNECLVASNDPEKIIAIVKKLPTINRRVMLFVVSLLQLFLQENIQSVTKMTSVAMALVISPALLRCRSDSFSTVFTNTQHEHTFVHNMLLHLQPHRIDPDYIPVHGLGSGKSR